MKTAGLIISIFLLIFATHAFAQTGTEGSILGTITDSTGAAIPEAAVTITNTETGVVKKAISDGTGYFQVLALPRGVYAVNVQKTGFASWQLSNIEVTAQENKRISPVLQVGAAQQEVTVEAGIDLVQTEQSGLAGA